jgi:hypothetical protein
VTGTGKIGRISLHVIGPLVWRNVLVGTLELPFKLSIGRIR